MYKIRNINFKEHLRLGEWRIKSYTISDKENFESTEVYNQSIQNLTEWLTQLNSFNSKHFHIAFLIVHEATEGVFSLINTWVDGSMLQTHVFLTKYDEPNVATKISGDGLFACVWELAVIEHERKSWLNHILQNNEQDKFKSYLNEVINTRF